MKRILAFGLCAALGLMAAMSMSGCASHATAQEDPMRGYDGLARSADDEVWIIARDTPVAHLITPPQAETPASGALMTLLSGETELIPLPPKHTAVNAAIAGYIARVDVTQQFHNPHESKIEVFYTFGLPDHAAVTEFIMHIGDRRIRGIIRERAEAQRIYKLARSRGRTASLMTHDRSHTFTQRIANIAPGRQIDVAIRYFHTMRYEDGSYEWIFPLAAGHAISLAVELDARLDVEDLAANSPVHIEREGEGDDRATHITLAAQNFIPSGDFVLRYRVAGKPLKPDPVLRNDGSLSLAHLPAEDLHRLVRDPLEVAQPPISRDTATIAVDASSGDQTTTSD